MKYAYSEFLDILDWEFQQEKQGGDSANADKFRYLPHTQAERVINETMKELAMISPDQFEREYTYVFEENQNYLTLPDFIFKTIAWWDDTYEKWRILGDSSDLTSTITSTRSGIIYNSDGWEEDNTIKFKVLVFPPLAKAWAGSTSVDITAVDGRKVSIAGVEFGFWDEGGKVECNTPPTATTALIDEISLNGGSLWLDREFPNTPTTIEMVSEVTFPEPYYRLLILEIKRKVYARKGKALSSYEYSELMKLKAQWMEETSSIQHKASIAFEGFGLGR